MGKYRVAKCNLSAPFQASLAKRQTNVDFPVPAPPHNTAEPPLLMTSASNFVVESVVEGLPEVLLSRVSASYFSYVRNKCRHGGLPMIGRQIRVD